jgi:hypothetical protein
MTLAVSSKFPTFLKLKHISIVYSLLPSLGLRYPNLNAE